MFWLLIPVLVAVAGDEDVDFGGARSDDVAASAVAPSPDSALRPLDFKGGGAPQQQRSGESAVQEPAPVKKTTLEIELENAHIDPAKHPLVQLRVDVARLLVFLDDKESHGLSAARDVEEQLAQARALLADAERIGMHRMMVCVARTGGSTRMKNVRMTAAGPVRLSTAEVMAQTSAIDPDGCSRIDLVDQALVDRLRRAHDVKNTLMTVSFPYARIAERWALETELKKLEKELALEDLPVLSVPGLKDPYGR